MFRTAREFKSLAGSLLSKGLVAAVIVFLGGGAAQAVSPIVKVEEEWELVVGEPDPDSVSPQVTCTMSPNGGTNGIHATFEVNSQSLASYSAGGLQLQIWSGETAIAASRHPEHNVLANTHETITWTSSMEVKDGRLYFAIRDGHSNTWGSFGGQGYLTHSMETSLADLSGYHVDNTVENSGVGYAANRVYSLKLVKLRATAADGTQSVQSTPIVVHPSGN